MIGLYNRKRELEPAYTHADHGKACGEAARCLQVLSQQHVLAKRGQVVYCAVIKEPWTTPSGIDCWTIETSWPERTRITVPVRNVILCPSEGCSCAGFACAEQAFPDPAFCQAGVVAPPDSPDFGNSSVFGEASNA